MTIHFIGAGPGAADLLTVRAVNLIRTSEVCVYAGTYIGAEILANCPSGALLIDTAKLNLDQITTHMLDAHARGQDVARLCSGDPSLYSALAEQSSRLDAAGAAWDVTPGVPAYAAAAAAIGKELTVPEVTQSVVLTRTQARSTKMPESESLANFARSRATLALHLGITRIRVMVEDLIPEYGSDCPVVVVFHASQRDELILRGTLADISDQVEAADLRQAAVILVGPAVGPAVGDAAGAESHLYDKARQR